MADNPSKAVRLFERLIRNGVIPIERGAGPMFGDRRPAITREFPVFAASIDAAARGTWPDEAEQVGEQSLVYADPESDPVSAPIALPDYDRAAIPDPATARELAKAIDSAHHAAGPDSSLFRTLRFNELGIFALWLPDRFVIPVETGAHRDALEQGRHYAIHEIRPIISRLARERLENAAKAATTEGKSPKA